MIDNIEGNDFKVGGKDLKVRVQGAPDVADRRGHYRRAVFALKKFAVEDEDFILVPNSFDIHDAKTLDLLGMVTDSGYVWDEAAMKTYIP